MIQETVKQKEVLYYSSYFPDSECFQQIKRDLRQLAGEQRKVYWRIKRVFDVFCSASGLILLSPLFLLIGILIYLDDPHGSCFYSQIRVGRKGKCFKMWKFRSMVVDADKMLDGLREKNEKDGPVFKMRDDPRVTKIGRFIRKTSMDELPQLWNVLKGDMSLVGPRPALPNEVSLYNEFQKQRLLVTPGLTCYWQVSAHRDKIGFEEWVAMDIRYIYDRSWLLDLKLILKTVKAVFKMEGS